MSVKRFPWFLSLCAACLVVSLTVGCGGGPSYTEPQSDTDGGAELEALEGSSDVE
jgi:hypothetical protein